ncbi:MAG TPA: hypothetical protein VEF89_11725 [Solirubrobacteraceae bacterium]|nr:hypothetical protein [Solirubrobacteraceae bacterium]
MHRSLKGKLAIGLAVLGVAAFAGAAYAATQNAGPNTRQAFLNDVAKRLHVTPQQLNAALNGAELDQLQAAVKAGRLSQAQANALAQRLKRNGGAVPVPFGLFGPGGPGGPGGMLAPGVPGGPGAPGSATPRLRAFPVPFAVAGGIGSAASYLGLTNAKLFQQLSSGKSLAQIATAQHKSVSGLEQAMLGAVKSRLDKLVMAKVITSAQEQQTLSRWRTRLSQQVNTKGLQFPKLRAPALRFHGSMPAPPNGPASSLGPAAQLFASPAPSA